MRVQQAGDSGAVLADDGNNARQSDLQLFRFRRERQKQAALRGAGGAGCAEIHNFTPERQEGAQTGPGAAA